jgi:putative heme-binding domain-containing protein
LASGAFGRVEPVLTNLLGETEHPRLQIAALDVLSTFDDAVIAGVILSYWEQLSPRDRPAAWKVLAGRTTWLMDLLDAITSGSVDPAAADAEVRLLSLDHPDPAIRDRASALFDEDPEADAVDGAPGASVIDDPARVLSLTGHAEDGRGVFYAQCAACHSPSPRALGPNLIGVSNKSREQLLEAIVAPGRAIPGSYAAYVAELTDGSIVSGRVVSESPGILTLRSLAGDRRVLRSRIATIRQAERSLMPPEAAGELSPQQLADVIAFLRAARE